jgi:hypothetical protein
MPPRVTEDKVALEKRAYSLVDEMVVAVFRDKEFQKAL